MAKSTKTADEGLIWDKRGARLLTLRASCSGSASAAVWEALAARVMIRRAPKDEPEQFADGAVTALEEPWTPNGHILNVYVHDGTGHSKKKKTSGTEAHWTFEVEPVPPFPPPAEVHAHSRRVGGIAGVLESLGRGWPSKKPLAFRITATYLLDGARHGLDGRLQETKLAPLKLRGKKSQSATPRGVILEIGKGAEQSLLTVQYPSAKEPFSMTWSGTKNLKLNEQLVGSLDDQVWQTLEPFLSPKK